MVTSSVADAAGVQGNYTPLHYAAMSNNCEIATHLLKAGALTDEINVVTAAALFDVGY